MGYRISASDIADGRKQMQDQWDYAPNIWGVVNYVKGHVVFGEFPPAIRAFWRRFPAEAPGMAWESWGITRMGKEVHKEWVRI